MDFRKYQCEYFEPLCKFSPALCLSFGLGWLYTHGFHPRLACKWNSHAYSYMSTGSMMELETLDALRLFLSLMVGPSWPLYLLCYFALCIFLVHFPCATTLLTIRKETQSWKWTFVSFLVPTIVGILVCFIFAQTVRFLGLI